MFSYSLKKIKKIRNRYKARSGAARHSKIVERKTYSCSIDGVVARLIDSYNWQHARVFLPGANSTNGFDVDHVETTLRSLPLLALVGKSTESQLANLGISHGHREACNSIIRDFFSKGFEPLSPCFIGDPSDYSQLLVDAHDLAVTLIILGDSEFINSGKNDSKLHWLHKCYFCRFRDNNWLLFKQVIGEVLLRYGMLKNSDLGGIQRILSWECADGYFVDGADGGVDCYSIWGFGYSLGWLAIINPEKYFADFSRVNIRQLTINRIFSESGEFLPLWGRSLCYRMALGLPHSWEYLLSGDQAESNKAKAYFYHFALLNGVSNGRITQGVFEDSNDLLDSYSGPGSPLWGLRFLVPLLMPSSLAKNLRGPSRLKPNLEAFSDNINFFVTNDSFCRSKVMMINSKSYQGPNECSFKRFLKGLVLGKQFRICANRAGYEKIHHANHSEYFKVKS